MVLSSKKRSTDTVDFTFYSTINWWVSFLPIYVDTYFDKIIIMKILTRIKTHIDSSRHTLNILISTCLMEMYVRLPLPHWVVHMD